MRGGEVRLIDYYESAGEDLPHYAQVLKAKGYVYGKHWAPHDIEVLELTSGRTRRLSAAVAAGGDVPTLVDALKGPGSRFGFWEDEKMRLRSNGTALGWGVGAAIGAQLGDPDRQVVLSIGNVRDVRRVGLLDDGAL